MHNGLNQEVQVLGRTFHFQTELTRKGDLYIRTEVFVGGKIVATREKRIGPEAKQAHDQEALLAAMKELHNAVIDSTVRRVEAYRKRKDSSPEDQEAKAQELSLETLVGKEATLPSDELRSAAASAVRIRRIFGRFRLRLQLGERLSASEIAERLTVAGRGFTWILSSPTFEEIRVDEQMRCHLVSDWVSEWLAGDRDEAEAEKIWAEIVTFNHYVAEINNRAELIAFDRQLLAWAAHQIQGRDLSEETRDMTDDVFDQLQWLSGRDLELDRLLDRPAEVTAETWFDAICKALAKIPASAAD